MHVRATEPEPAWREALCRAAKELPSSDPLADVFLEDREDLRVELDGRAVSEVVESRSRGLSVRTAASLAYRSNPEPDDAFRLVRAVGAAGSRPRPVVSRSADFLGGAVPGPDAGFALGFLRNVTERAIRAVPGQTPTVVARWVGLRQGILVIRSGGAPQQDVRQGARVYLEVRIQKGDARSTAVGEMIVRGPTMGIVAEALADDVARRAQERLGARPLPSGETSVIFAPGVGGILIHEIVGHGLEADTVLAGGSVLAASERPIARPQVVVVDDPRRSRAPWRVDDEGQEARATPLVQGGRVTGWLLDRRAAAQVGRACTGHGRRSSFHQPVLPRMGCTFLGPGDLDPREVLEGTSSGVFVRRMEAAGADPGTGRAFFRVSDADRVRGGRIEFPLEPFLLRVKTPEGLASLDRIASDLAFDTCIGSCVRDGQPLATSVGAPTFRIGVATVFS